MRLHRIGFIARALGAALVLCGPAWAGRFPDAVLVVPADAGRGHAWNDPAFARVPQELGSLGYAEREYLFHGEAGVYGSAGGSVRVEASGPYVDRMLIRYPANLSRFSGNVIFEWLNGNLGFDAPAAWPAMWRQITRNGDIWVGMSTKSLATLRRSDPARYGLLSFANPRAGASTAGCQQPAEEDALAYDAATQAANLLRQRDHPLNPLHGLNVQTVIATGYSQSALLLATYTSLIVPTLGYLPFDGYLVSSGIGGGNLNACAAAPPGIFPLSHGEPVMQTQTPSETTLLLLVSQQPGDGDSLTNKYRYYDLPGTGHIDQTLVDGLPRREELAPLGIDMDAALAQCGAADRLSRFPSHVLYDNLLARLEAWVRVGTPPPPSRRFLFGGLFGLGTPLGGVRSPGVDAPTANYAAAGGLTIPLLSALFQVCPAFVVQEEFPAATLSMRYRSHQNYVDQVQASVAAQVGNGYLTGYDGDELIRQAQAANVPP